MPRTRMPAISKPGAPRISTESSEAWKSATDPESAGASWPEPEISGDATEASLLTANYAGDGNVTVNFQRFSNGVDFHLVVL